LNKILIVVELITSIKLCKFIILTNGCNLLNDGLTEV